MPLVYGLAHFIRSRSALHISSDCAALYLLLIVGAIIFFFQIDRGRGRGQNSSTRSPGYVSRHFVRKSSTLHMPSGVNSSVREMVEDQRNRGYNAWIEDESGQRLDEEPLKKSGRSLHQKLMVSL